MSLDPKRYCQKFVNLQEEIASSKFFRVGEVLEPVAGPAFSKEDSAIYRYVEIQNVGAGDFDFEELRGWQLPQRATLQANAGDFFIAHLWSSAGKWFMAPTDTSNMLVTNGCGRFQIKSKKKEFLVDLISGLCSEAFRVQLRALTTGSDGLAEVGDADVCEIVLPRITDQSHRGRLQRYFDTVMNADVRLSKAVGTVLSEISDWPRPPRRKSHCALV